MLPSGDALPLASEREGICKSAGIMSVMAFHEKAGRSQVDSVVFSLDKVFLLPSCHHCRHPSIRTLCER